MPKTWNQFVTEYSQKHGVSRKEAMSKARPAWQKYKRSIPKGNSIPGFKKRDDVIDWPPKKKRKKGGSSIPHTTIHRVNHRGGAIIQPNVAEIIRRQHHTKRKRKRHTIFQDSAYNTLARQTGVHKL